MARLPLTGKSVSSLYERTPVFEEMIKAGAVDPRECETTLADVISGLRLAPLSTADEQIIRHELGLIIGWGLRLSEESAKQNPEALTVRGVQATLIRVADLLDPAVARELDPDQFAAIDAVMKGAETGFRKRHDIEVALRIRSALSREIGLSNANDRMAHYRKWPRTIAEACRVAAQELDSIKGSAGRQSREWYPSFKSILTRVATINGINPKVVIDRRTHDARGRFIEIVEQFERLLPRHMRSPSREAIAKMLERSNP
jgi:hypothetical protein